MAQVPEPPITICWQKSTKSGASGCAEVACAVNYVWIRDSKSPCRPVLGVTSASWAAFVLGVWRDEFGPA